MDSVAAAVFRCSVQATLLIPVVLGIRWMVGKRLGVVSQWWLWWIVAGRLLLPWSPGAPFSLFGLIDNRFWSVSRITNPQPLGRGVARPSDSPPKTPVPSRLEIVMPGAVVASPISAEPSNPNRSLSLVRLLAWLWILGFAVVVGKVLMDSLRIRRWVRTRTTEAGPRMLGLLEECRRTIGVSRAVSLRLGAWVRAPSVCGAVKPTILLPTEIDDAVSFNQLRYILLHELAHLERNDLRSGLVLRLVQALHWFNPAVSWLLRRMRLHRELATDARVLGAVGGAQRSEYGETLLALMAKGSARSSGLGAAALGTTDRPADMEKRIRAIASFTPGRERSRIGVLLIAFLAVVCWTNAELPGRPGKKTVPPDEAGSLLVHLPTGEDLGKGWSNRVTSLVDRVGTTQEYFDAGVFEPARVLIRSRVPKGTAFCDAAYFRDGNLVFDAWLRCHESTNRVTEEWNRLLSAPLRPRLSDGALATRSSRRVGGLEAILCDGDGRTLWVVSGQWMLNLNFYEKVTLDEVFSIAEVFARRLPPSQHAALNPDKEPNPAAETDWYTVHSIGDLYTAVRRVHTNRVSMSQVFRRPQDARAYLTITNSESEPILIWNVRVQVRGGATKDNPDEWNTVSSEYPSCAAGIAPGATADVCVQVPSSAPWRVALLYSVQPGDAQRAAGLPEHLRGDHEIISGIVETVDLALEPEHRSMRRGESARQSISLGDQRLEVRMDEETTGLPSLVSKIAQVPDLAGAAGLQYVRIPERPPARSDGFHLVNADGAIDLPQGIATRDVPVVIAFEASWSWESGVNRKILKSSRLQGLFESSRAELCLVDCTREDPSSAFLRYVYDIKHLPGYAVFSPGRKTWTVLEGAISEDSIGALMNAP
ncbi:MAG: M56 family metallopeptidase [Verrucomicrobiales bacterium]|nr:M56 family metallopeptidase [Verrucomicrobiales bacterium]